MRRGLLLGALAAMAVLVLPLGPREGRCMAGELPKRYLLPVWFTGQLQPQVGPDRITVKARLQVNLLLMRKAAVRLEAGDGLELLTSRVLSAPGAIPGASSVEGDLAASQSCTFEATFKRKPDADHGFVTLAFDYDFPADEMLEYIAAHRADLYPDDELRRLLQKSVVESLRGRKSDGITERVEFAAGGAR